MTFKIGDIVVYNWDAEEGDPPPPSRVARDAQGVVVELSLDDDFIKIAWECSSKIYKSGYLWWNRKWELLPAEVWGDRPMKPRYEEGLI